MLYPPDNGDGEDYNDDGGGDDKDNDWFNLYSAFHCMFYNEVGRAGGILIAIGPQCVAPHLGETQQCHFVPG